MPRFLKRVTRPGNDRGQATVEFALLLPTLLFLILVMVDFGKAFNYWIDETHLVNAAARWAVVNAAPDSTCTSGGACIANEIKAQADTSELRSGGASITGSGVRITFCFESNGAGQPTPVGKVGESVRATATANYHWLRFLTGSAGLLKGFGDKSITTTATMRIEQKYDNTVYTASAC